jgi:hypothetical protein
MSPGTGLLTNHPMSESTRTSADGGTSDTLNVEDLFATDDTDISIDDGESDDDTTTASTEATPDAEDTTADELFAQLRDEHDDAEQAHAVDDVTDESPEDIMARADEAAEHVDQIDESIRADEGALDDLLLTERREADGFLWVETENDDASDDVAALFEADASDDDGRDDDQRAATGQSAGDDDFSLAAGTDDFSLAAGTDDSSETRATTFDADDFGADASSLDDAQAASDDAQAASDDAQAANEDAQAASDDAQAASDDAQAASDDNSDGLADRIRSILTG